MTKSEIFKMAWKISKQASTKFGGKAFEYIALALKSVWSLSKKANLSLIMQAMQFCIYKNNAAAVNNYFAYAARALGTADKEVVCAEIVKKANLKKEQLHVFLSLDIEKTLDKKAWYNN